MQRTGPTATTAIAWSLLAALLLGDCASALAGSARSTGQTRSPAAAVLADPTRPPAAMLAGAPMRSASTGLPANGARSAATAAPAVLPASVLQSLQLPLRGPAVAMVDGRLVKSGDMLGTRTVLSIDSQGLVLRGEGGTERLPLLVGSTKQAPGSIAGTRATRFVAAPEPDADPLAQAERNPAGLPSPPAGSTMSLVGRIKP